MSFLNSLRFFDKLILGVLILSFCGMTYSQPAPPDRTIDAAMQKEIIDSISATLNRVYVFPEVAKKMESFARQQYNDNAYKEMTSLTAFANQLSQDMFSVCNDQHFGIRYLSDEDMPRTPGTPTPEELEAANKRLQYNNYNWDKVERLPGNIGYVKFDGFTDAPLAAPTTIAAMNFLAYCDAIIFDLRENGGGSPSLIQLISSYFFDEPTHLNSFYIRETDSITQFWTQASVTGPRMSNCEIYVLTSNYTFSGAEEFSYNMRNLERGTIVGEVTGGGAHPVNPHYFPNLNIGVRIPFGRAINPISGTNWEGVGVKPHIEVPAIQALDVAYTEALKKVLEKTDDENRKNSINWILDIQNVKLNPVMISEKKLKTFVGTYGPRILSLENGSLYYQREGRPKYKMIPFSEDTFYFDDLDYFRLKVETDTKGKPVALIGIYDNGHTDRSPKN